jgi:glutathione S-transferase
MIRLLGRATSGNVQKVIFLLEELGVPYTREDYGRQFENTATPEYAAINPTRKVPTLVDGETIIWESHAILRYLATTHASPLYPTDPASRAKIDPWMDWLLASLNPVFLAGFQNARKPVEERAPDVGKNLAAELKILEDRLAKTAWLAGDHLSLADIALGPIVRRCIAFPYDMPPTAALAEWCARLNAMPAFKTATAAG